MSLSEEQLDQLMMMLAAEVYLCSMNFTAGVKCEEDQKHEIKKRAFALLASGDGILKLKAHIKKAMQHDLN